MISRKCIDSDSKLRFNLDIGLNLIVLYEHSYLKEGIPIEDIDPIERRDYFWFPVSREYNLKRLEILEKEIDNQLREEGLGE